MPRTIWTGSLTFGLVTIPVGLYPATTDKAIHFNQFEEGTSDRIRYKKVNERTGQEVESARIVRGVDLGGGEYVVLSDEELAEAEPKRSRTVEITDFVELEDIDPVYFRTTYYLAPHDEAAAKPYALLQRAMQKAGRVAIATLVMRNKEYLVAIRPQGAALTLETMFFADEVRSAERELPYLSGVAEPSEREVELASVLVDAMKGEWEPERYHDTHRERVDELVEEKRQGREIVHEPAPAAAGRVVDLMEALQASVAAAAGRSSAPEAEPAPARRPVKAASAGTARRAQAPAPVRRGGGATRGQPAEASQGDGADGADEAKGRSSARRTRQAAKAAPAAGSRDAPKAKKAAKRPAAARLREVS